MTKSRSIANALKKRIELWELNSEMSYV